MTLCFSFRDKPKPSKKARLNKAAEEDAAPEQDKTPNLESFIPEDIPNDPPLQDDAITDKRPIDTSVLVDQPANSVRIDGSRSPSKPADKPTVPTQTGESKDDDVVITGVGRFEPGNPIALAKHTVKEDFSSMNKGKWDVDLETYAALNARDLHSGYLNRLYTSCDCEAGMVNMMRDKFEVTSLCFFFL